MGRDHTDLEHDFLQPSLTIEDAESESESDDSYYPELGSEPDTEDEVGVMGSCVNWFSAVQNIHYFVYCANDLSANGFYCGSSLNGHSL